MKIESMDTVTGQKIVHGAIRQYIWPVGVLVYVRSVICGCACNCKCINVLSVFCKISRVFRQISVRSYNIKDAIEKLLHWSI